MTGMRSVVGAMAVALVLGSVLTAEKINAEEINWQRIEIEPKFRSEGVTAFDVNKDGKVDVVTGDVWWEAPNWTRHEIRKPGEFGDGAGGYSQSFACFHADINADGWTDLICIGFPGVVCHWYENPKNEPGHWKQSEIWHSAAGESPQFLDVTGDKKPELVMASEPEGMVGYLELPPPAKCYEKWTFTAVSEKKPGMTGTHRYYHGLGVGDVNGDGRTDIVMPHGWWEAPAERTEGPWKFHPVALNLDGQGGGLPAADLFVDDLDLDGDQDILGSSAHAKGIWWFENTAGKGNEPVFKGHVIDDHFSQTHALHYQDIDGDGERDLITGKRFWAHGPKGDIDPDAEVVMYWYGVHKKAGSPPQFVPHKIEAGVGTGIGTQFSVADVDGDKQLDVILSNKRGTNLLLQRREKAVIGK